MKTHFLLVLTLSALTMSKAQFNEKSVIENRKHSTLMQQPQSNPVLIDSIRHHYITLENDLWNLIDGGIDTAYVLEQIHGAHLKFFDQPFREFNITFEDYSFDRRTQLLDIVSDINKTVSVVVKNSLRENSLSFTEKAAIDTNRYQIDLNDQIDTLFNTTSTKEFYETIKKVSLGIFQCSYHGRFALLIHHIKQLFLLKWNDNSRISSNQSFHRTVRLSSVKNLGF